MSKNKVQTKEINITGIVQGVGFRPFIFNLAREYDLKLKSDTAPRMLKNLILKLW